MTGYRLRRVRIKLRNYIPDKGGATGRTGHATAIIQDYLDGGLKLGGIVAEFSIQGNVLEVQMPGRRYAGKFAGRRFRLTVEDITGSSPR